MPNKKQIDNIHYTRSLSEFIDQEYGLTAISIEPAKRGYYGETWKMDTANGSYFLKLDYSLQHQKKYSNSLSVVDYLCGKGIDFISKITKTKTGGLFAIFNTAVLVVFDWVDGENIETDETKISEYKMLSKIYAISKPGFTIPKITFSNDKAVDFFMKWEQLKAPDDNKERQEICSVLEQRAEMLTHYAARLQYFAAICQKDTVDLYITHGDAGGNLLVGKDSHYIIDWDEAAYAALERDAWIMSVIICSFSISVRHWIASSKAEIRKKPETISVAGLWNVLFMLILYYSMASISISCSYFF